MHIYRLIILKPVKLHSFSGLAEVLCVLSCLLICMPARLTFNLTGLCFQVQETVTPAGTSASTAIRLGLESVTACKY